MRKTSDKNITNTAHTTVRKQNMRSTDIDERPHHWGTFIMGENLV